MAALENDVTASGAFWRSWLRRLAVVTITSIRWRSSSVSAAAPASLAGASTVSAASVASGTSVASEVSASADARPTPHVIIARATRRKIRSRRSMRPPMISHSPACATQRFA
jgi:hypothetical protein